MAIADYIKTVKEQHSNLKVMASGLVVNTKYPHLGASPDGIIQCDCCGVGCLEIKCPYLYRDASASLNTVDYIDEQLQLKHDHMYYYQVQAQIHICQVEFADFVIWSPQGLNIERIVASEDFFIDKLADVEAFYKYCLLPELVGKWYTRQSVMPQRSSTSTSSTSSSTGTPNHSSHDVPKVNWYCPDCRKLFKGRHPPKILAQSK
jgi:hypothetical protein